MSIGTCKYNQLVNIDKNYQTAFNSTGRLRCIMRNTSIHKLRTVTLTIRTVHVHSHHNVTVCTTLVYSVVMASTNENVE